MKFILFNLVVGAALVYLLMADRADQSVDTVPGPVTARPELAPVTPVPVAATRNPLAQPALVGSAEARQAGPASPLLRTPRNPPPIDPVHRSTQAPESVAVGASRTEGEATGPVPPDAAVPPPSGSTMSGLERGRSLRDLARDMESRFLTGLQ